MSDFSKKVYEVVSNIPKGETMTYKQVAAAAGKPKAARAAGNILNKNRDPGVPCHRVIKSNGQTGGYAFGPKRKEDLLKRESAI
jgi:O-6-methylguanine DNA methyltransferase